MCRANRAIGHHSRRPHKSAWTSESWSDAEMARTDKVAEKAQQLCRKVYVRPPGRCPRTSVYDAALREYGQNSVWRNLRNHGTLRGLDECLEGGLRLAGIDRFSGAG